MLVHLAICQLKVRDGADGAAPRGWGVVTVADVFHDWQKWQAANGCSNMRHQRLQQLLDRWLHGARPVFNTSCCGTTVQRAVTKGPQVYSFCMDLPGRIE